LAQLRQRVEQDAVVARMQADGRLVEDVADALQVGAELGGQPDALRLAARQRRRGAVERQVAEADLAQEGQAAQLDRMSRAISALAAGELQAGEEALDRPSTGRAVRSAIDWSRKRTASATGSGARRRRRGRRPLRPLEPFVPPISSPVCSASKPASFRPVP
jgi:hypothetical protein